MCVPEELNHQSDIDGDIVAGDHNLPPGLPGEQRTDEITRVAGTPDYQEEDGEAGGRLQLVVLVYLRQLGEEP